MQHRALRSFAVMTQVTTWLARVAVLVVIIHVILGFALALVFVAATLPIIHAVAWATRNRSLSHRVHVAYERTGRLARTFA